jgi:hypothetical protein
MEPVLWNFTDDTGEMAITLASTIRERRPNQRAHS